jgi:hypothetical protein
MVDNLYVGQVIRVPTHILQIRFGHLRKTSRINEKDCNVTHPIDVCESPCFKADRPQGADSSICYSSYQRELNKLYLIASPIIEVISGLRVVGCSEPSAGPHYTTQIIDVTEKLWTWRRRLALTIPAMGCIDSGIPCGANLRSSYGSRTSFDGSR